MLNQQTKCMAGGECVFGYLDCVEGMTWYKCDKCPNVDFEYLDCTAGG